MQDTQQQDFKFDRQNLYREETFTDLKIGSIRQLTPVKSDGTHDKTRKTVYVGHTNILTPGGSLPIQSVIKAKSLQQAIKRFPEAIQVAVDQLADEVKKYQEQQQGRIVSPTDKDDSRIIIPGR